MKITDAKVFVGGPGKNYVTVKVMTDSGVYGLGDATLNNRETLPAKYLTDYLVPNLIGMDPRRSEDIWQFLYRGAYFRRGPVAMAAFGAIDMALWDIKGKLADMPLYQLFGGKSRDGAMVYGHATGADLEDLMDSIAHYVEQGYKAVRVQCGIPGMPTASYAVPEERGASKHYISDFSGIRPKTEIWDSGKYLRWMPGALMAIRERFGPDLHILHDVHHRLTPREAAQFAKAVEPVDLYWLEDPTPAEDQAALRLVRQHSTTPIAIGEVFNSIWECNKLIEEELIDFIRVAATYAGGITHVKRIVDLAGLHHVRTGFHGAPSHSPLCMAAHAHLNAWAPNFGIQEYLVLGTPDCDALFPSDHRMEDGMVHVSDAPGLGVDFDEAEAARYEYRPGSHPVVRLTDGTMWDY
ncbi:mandelate racemase / muconate lactonizing enzyme family protein [Oceanicola granulosus HTCC2516]|uniref:D-galactonate dehydratase family member OG2516_05608 n=1 Tax=Oceanicola granulosus (strain ATCC BAA-861 / DSM 15982 / KCTC 12143 / HTCC2516) TaxID=314256 RepID=IMAND_OCEGH|nr:D-mannonate dehydratase ManD [Oceanicola granulosus]Q2CIN0.1 RecName: Full=D-galactonate dehydratase family member OG2516_05608 [Oceanicola granulosus HTCC2516]EAR52559.1 mandelate racemase / muconate lactonizing enzyme family protein [Oceanicola granulosus HTCC2516]